MMLSECTEVFQRSSVVEELLLSNSNCATSTNEDSALPVLSPSVSADSAYDSRARMASGRSVGLMLPGSARSNAMKEYAKPALRRNIKD